MTLPRFHVHQIVGNFLMNGAPKRRIPSAHQGVIFKQDLRKHNVLGKFRDRDGVMIQSAGQSVGAD